ncbi:hypothetical protein BHE74_00043119, partial [Ensete ventricosum]
LPDSAAANMAMRANLRRLWHGSQTRHSSLESKGKSAPASNHSPIKLVVAALVALLVIVFFISNTAVSIPWIFLFFFLVLINREIFSSPYLGLQTFSWSEQGVHAESLKKQPSKAQAVPVTQPSKAQAMPITLTCSNQTSPTCKRSSNMVSALSLTTSQQSPTCPEYFRWIHEDLRPWKSTGITKEMVEGAQKLATFRLVVLDGRVYVEEYFGRSMTRNVFTLWGVLQLVNRYPGRVPDLDLMFNCMDQPSVRSAEYSSLTLPPVFHYCKDDQTSDILFPDWSFWGW